MEIWAMSTQSRKIILFFNNAVSLSDGLKWILL
ncbi:MAG: hypothetical protein ACI8V8_001928 [Chitinophagales bacterium]